MFSSLSGRSRAHFCRFVVFVAAVSACGGVQPQDEASRAGDPRFPTAASKKGLLVELYADIPELAIKHATVNLDLTRLIDPQHSADCFTWETRGRKYSFNRLQLERVERRIKRLSDEGILVYVILLTYQGPDAEANRLMLHPGCVGPAPNRICAFNTVSEEGRGWFRAVLEFLAARWSKSSNVDGNSQGRVVGYILGNEVNSHWWWCNRGETSLDEFVDYYADAARIAHQAIRRHSSWARLYVSLDHHWGTRYPAGNDKQAFSGRQFIDRFAHAVRGLGDFDWHLAYHPYPEDLFDPRFWDDESATPEVDSPKVTFKNLDVLTRYLRRPELLYESRPRSIILSEQGFHSPDGEEGELLQAAAFCLAYKKVESLNGIDAFILHRHVDHPQEGGLRLGLRGWAGPGADHHSKTKIYECFRLADTPQWEAAFDFALPIVGLRSWDEIH